MHVKLIAAFLMLSLTVGCGVTPQRVASPEDPFAMPIDEFMLEHAILRAHLVEGEPRELDEDEWEKFDDISARLVDLVGEATELEQIDMRDRHQIYELRTQMVNVVVGDVEPAVVCFRQHVTGTRLRGNRRCYTLEDLEKDRFIAQEIMRYIQNIPQGEHPDGMDPGPLTFQ
jgi:hypothetical protein